MAIVASWTGDGLAAGPLTAGMAGVGDTGFNTVTTGAFTVTDDGRIQMDQQLSTAAQLIWSSATLGSLSGYAVRGYVELSAYPSAGAPILQAFASGALRWRLDVTSTGLVRLRDASNAIVATASSAVPLNTELRVEAVINADAATALVYLGDEEDALVELSGTVGAGADEVRWGNTQTAPTWPRLWWDDLAVADTPALIGPVPAPEPEPEPEPRRRFPLDDRYELLLDGAWVDITGYVYERDPVTITRGRSAEADTADPAQMTLTLDNRDGRFSPRNPVSPYYGKLGRNTQIRAFFPGDGGCCMRVMSSDDMTGQATAPDAAPMGITGDLDIRIEVDAETWEAGDLAAKYNTEGDQRSWSVGVERGRRPSLYWSPDGTLASRQSASATAPIPISEGHLALRVVLDVDNGAGGHSVTFYTADTIDGPWTQLGDTVTRPGTTSVFDSTAPLEVGSVPLLTLVGTPGGAVPGRYIAFELRDGINGTVVAGPDFTAQREGATSFTDDQGNTWTLGAGAEIVANHQYRFWGEVAAWPATWAVGGVDRYVSITANGLKRRLTQNAPALRSPMFRSITARDSLVAYWPMEDSSEATQIASGLPGGLPMTVQGTPELGGYSGWTSTDPVPTMGGGRLAGQVAPYNATGEIIVWMFVFVDEPPSAETSLLRLSTTGTIREWDIRLQTDGDLTLRAYGPDGEALLDRDISDADTLPRGFFYLALELRQTGSHVGYLLRIGDFVNTIALSDEFPYVYWDGTITNQTIGAARTVVVGHEQGLGQTIVGHLLVASDIEAISDQVTPTFAIIHIFEGIAAYNGEAAETRMARLCSEEGIRFAAVTKGKVGNRVTLGDQPNRSLVELLEEAAGSDGGILYEPRDVLGFAYRTRLSMYNQAPAVVLDYSGRQITGDLTPVDDDRYTVNDLTVRREAGSSVRVEQTTGPLSTAEPPDGVGRYSGEVTLSLKADDQLADQAGWRLHLGTVDEARYPTLSVNLRATGITDELYEKILDLDVGDRIVVTGIPAGLPPDDVSLLVQGYTETLSLYRHEITFNLTPESPWHVGQIGTDGYDRVDTAGSELAEDADEDATELVVAITEGPVWTSDPDDLPFDVMVAGERVTVTAVDGSAGQAEGFLAADSFDRTETSTWGTADTGQTWATQGGDASHYTTDGSVASISVSAVSSGRYSVLQNQRHTDADVRADICCPTTPTGDATNAYLLARVNWNGSAVSAWYAATASFAEDGRLYLALEKYAGGVFAYVASPVDTGITFDASTWYTLRLQAVGPVLRAKVWERGTPEPASWLVEATDTDITVGNALSCRAFVESASTAALPVQVLFDNFRATVTQTLTVERSVNGVVKAQTAGAPVSLADPVYVAL